MSVMHKTPTSFDQSWNLLVISKVWPTTDVIGVDLILVPSTVTKVSDILGLVSWAVKISVVHNEKTSLQIIWLAYQLPALGSGLTHSLSIPSL